MRADLAALTPEVLAVQSNLGLVKRAQREIAAGQGPTVTLEGEVVVATFPDKVVTRLPPGKPWKDGPCSCGAVAACRHRIAAVLVWAAAAATPSRHPGELTPDELDRWLGDRRAALDAAEAVGVDVDLSWEPPHAAFSGTTVRFLAGADLAHARCDCGRAGCVHVGLSIRAFQADPERRGGRIRLGPPPSVPLPLPELEEAEGWLLRRLRHGTADAAGLVQPLAVLRDRLRGMPWLDGVLDELEAQRVAWESRSALHRDDHVRQLLAEGFARLRAARAGGDPRALLGIGEPLEVPLDRVRLLSLGARLGGGGRSLEVLLWDGVSVLSWTLAVPEKTDPSTMIALAGVPLATLAAGQVISRHLVRGARRTVELRRGRDTSVIPQRGEWGGVLPPVGFPGPTALLRDDAARPPEPLRPRARTEALRVVACDGVTDLAWSPGRQVLSGWLVDEGGALRVERAYEAFAPGALPALAAALPDARFVSGWLRTVDGQRVLEPIAVVTDRVVVPDLSPTGPPPVLPLLGATTAGPLEVTLGRLAATLEALARDGVLGGTLPDHGGLLAELGLRRFAEDYARLQRSRAAADAAGASEAWITLALRLAMVPR